MGRLSDAMIGDHYPHIAGYKEPTTSRLAAEEMNSHLAYLQSQVLQYIKGEGLAGATADETAQALGSTPGAIRPRCSELRKLGLIKAAHDKRRPSSTGRSSIVWVIC